MLKMFQKREDKLKNRVFTFSLKGYIIYAWNYCKDVKL